MPFANRLTRLSLLGALLFTWAAGPSVSEAEGGWLDARARGSDCCSAAASLFWADPCGCASNTAWPQCKKSLNGYAAGSYASLEYLTLFRDTLRSQPTIAPAPSFDNDLASGVLVTLGTEFAPDYRLEMSYFGSHDWNETSLVPNANPIAYGSQLNNLELVVRHRVPTWRSDFAASYSIGARIMDFEDELFVNAGSTFATNELLGLQGGLLMQFLVEPQTWVDWEFKGAVANNEARVRGLATQDVTSFIGETSVTANYQFLPTWTFRIGYRGIWATGLALAEENVNVPLVDDSGEIAFHGLNVGVVWTR